MFRAAWASMRLCWKCLQAAVRSPVSQRPTHGCGCSSMNKRLKSLTAQKKVLTVALKCEPDCVSAWSFLSCLWMWWSQKSSVRVAVLLSLFHSRLFAGLWVWRWPVLEKYLHPNTSILKNWQGQIEPCSDGLSGCSTVFFAFFFFTSFSKICRLH